MRYYLEVVLDHCGAEVRLNDIPVVRCGTGGISARCCVNMWVIPGRNVLTLKQIPPQDLNSESAANASVTLKKSVNNDPDRSVVLVARNLDFAEAFFDCNSSELPARPAWLDLHELTSPDITAIRDFVRELHEAVQVGDCEKILKYVEPSLKAGAVAFGFDPQVHQERYRELITSLFQDVNFQVSPLAESEFDFRLCGDGRMLSIVQSDGSDVIRSATDESGEWSLPMFIGMIDGKPFVVA